MNRISKILAMALLALLCMAAGACSKGTAEADGSKAENKGEMPDTKEIIFEHLTDNYGWEVPFSHTKRIPLPIIVKAQGGSFCVFSSAHIQPHGHGEHREYPEYTDGGATFRIAAPDMKHAGKVVQVITTPDGKTEYVRPIDISITKNVAALFVCVILVISIMLWLARWHRRKGNKAPRKGLGFIEFLVEFVYNGVIASTLGSKAPRFAPYLLSAFFFIFTMNLMGLVVIFPGGANLTGNIAVTLVMAVITFLVTNLFATKEYWKEIFWPDVPLWLKFPLPIMPLIEVFGMFTKPAALTVRLFANMMGGHIIVIVFTALIFIFYFLNPVAGFSAPIVTVLFSVFMLVIDVLVSFIQAYVFTMLSTIFISMAQAEPHEHKECAEGQEEEDCEKYTAEEIAHMQKVAAMREKEFQAAQKEASDSKQAD